MNIIFKFIITFVIKKGKADIILYFYPTSKKEQAIKFDYK